MTPEEQQFEREKFGRLVSLEKRVAAIEALADVNPYSPHPEAGKEAPVIPIGKPDLTDEDVKAAQKQVPAEPAPEPASTPDETPAPPADESQNAPETPQADQHDQAQ